MRRCGCWLACWLVAAVLLCLGAAEEGMARGTDRRPARRLTAVRGNATATTAASGRVQGAIAFGQSAARNDFPYIAYLFDDDGDYGCAGMLINPRAVLTAAHCMVGSDKRGPNPTFVRVGLWRWFTDKNQRPLPYEERRVVFTAVHPRYNYNSNHLDMAILILDRPVTTVRPVRLAPLNMRLRAGDPLWAAGWGSTQREDENVDTLMKVRLPYVSNARCAALDVDRPPSHICAGGGARKGDTCSGDSGGPLVKKARGAADVLVGITSFGPDDDCGLASTGAYTFVGHPTVRQWIAWALQGL